MKDFNLKKLYYSISEVSRITDLEQYILRYWETEFEILKPQKNRAGNRVYTNRDIKVILLIRSLLKDKKFTVEGAKKIIAEYSSSKELNAQLENLSNEEGSSVKIELSDSLVIEKPNSLKEDLLELRRSLEEFLLKL